MIARSICTEEIAADRKGACAWAGISGDLARVRSSAGTAFQRVCAFLPCVDHSLCPGAMLHILTANRCQA